MNSITKTLQIILFILLSAVVIFAQGQQDTFLVKPYLQYGQKTSMHVLWETNEPSTAVVEYTEAILNNTKTVNFTQQIAIKEPKNLHEIKLDNLKPSTKYLYRVNANFPNGRKIISDIKTFKTNVNDNEAFFFSFISDTQKNNQTPWAWGRIADLIWKERPNFVVMGGDLVDKGSVKTDWTHHFFPYGNIMMSRYPMYTILGNHEQDAQHYYDYMVNPEPEYYYTFTYGNAQFFMIDTNRDVTEGSEQYTWLDWELSKSTATWKFVVHHHPPYSSDSDDHGDTFHGASGAGSHARNLTPLFDKYNVDFDLFGHTHLYERTWPIFENKIDKVNGTIYINAGGAGGYLEDFDPVRHWFSLEQEVTHHYTTFAIHGDELIFKAINDKGELFDGFTLTKNRNKKTSTYSKPASPKLSFDKSVFQDEANLRLEKLSDEFTIRYTLDGSEPTILSPVYAEPLRIKESAELKAACFTTNGVSSGVVKQKFVKMQPVKAIVDKINTKPGLKYKYYEGEWQNIPEFSKLKPVKEGHIKLINLDGINPREQHFGISAEGYVEIPETNTYTFYLYTDDGSKMYINDQLLIDSDGNHGARYDYGTVILEKGRHKLKIDYIQQTGGYYFSAGIKVNGKDKKPFNPWQLSH